MPPNTKTKFVDEQYLDDEDFKPLQTQDELLATLKRLSNAINADAASDNRLVDVIGKNNSAIAEFMQAIKGLKFDVPEMNPNINLPAPIVHINQDKVAQAIENSTKSITEGQIEIKNLLQTLIDSRVSEWEFTRVDSNFMGGIQKATAKAIKFINDAG